MKNPLFTTSFPGTFFPKIGTGSAGEGETTASEKVTMKKYSFKF
jgi:hypothetical protein